MRWARQARRKNNKGEAQKGVRQTLIEFATDLENRAAGFNSADDLRVRLAQTNPQTDAVIANLDSLSNVEADAIAFLQQMHQQHPTVALMMITNGGADLTAREAAECGVHFFLREPIRLSEVEYYLTRI